MWVWMDLALIWAKFAMFITWFYLFFLVWHPCKCGVTWIIIDLPLIYPIQSSDLSHLLPQQDLTSMLARFLKEKYHAQYDPAETPEATSGGFSSKPCLDCWVSQDNLQFTIVYHSLPVDLPVSHQFKE